MMRVTRKDPLQEIDGIGPKCEQALHAAGIKTYRQIAAMTAVELAEICTSVRGMHASRIETEDWVGQARELAAKADDGAAQQYAVFTVKYLLTAERAVRRTELSYLQQPPEAPPVPPWSGWQPDKLLATMRSLAQIVVPETGAAASSVVAPEAEAPVSDTAVAEAKMAEELAALEKASAPLKLVTDVAVDEAGVIHHRLPASEPLVVETKLLAGDTDTAVEPPFTYKLTYYAKCLDTGEKRPLGQATGTATKIPAAVAPLAVMGDTLKPDLYRLLVEGQVKAGDEIIETSTKGQLVQLV